MLLNYVALTGIINEIPLLKAYGPKLNLIFAEYGTAIRSFYVIFFFLSLITRESFKLDAGKQNEKLVVVFTAAVMFIASAFLLILVDGLGLKSLHFFYPFIFIVNAMSGFKTTEYIRNHFFTHDENKWFGIKSQKRLKETGWSFNWKTANGYINVVKPQQGILCIGGAGAGKSESVAKPIIHQAVAKGFTGFIYDYKDELPLTNATHQAFIDYGVQDRKLWIINFSDITRSHRLNPIHPVNIPVSAFAEEYAQAILKNLNREWIQRQDFWAKSAITFLKAIIWYLRNNYPQYCTLPHVVALALNDYDKVIDLLATDFECKGIIQALVTAHQKQAESQVSGVVASLQTPLAALNTQEIFWVLSGHDFEPNINDPKNPAFVCVANNPSLQDTLSPVISLIATVVMKQINKADKLPSVFLLDEAPTLYIPNLHNLPATGRSNKISTVYMAQDFSQLDYMYGKDEARVIRSNLGNQFFGMVNDLETAERVSRIFGKEEKIMQSVGYSSNAMQSGSGNNNKNYSLQEKELVRPGEIMSLNQGEFVGKVTGAKGKKAFFYDKILIEEKRQSPILPFLDFEGQNFKNYLINNFLSIHNEMRQLLRVN